MNSLSEILNELREAYQIPNGYKSNPGRNLRPEFLAEIEAMRRNGEILARLAMIEYLASRPSKRER
jgi:hypothetical protein